MDIDQIIKQSLEKLINDFELRKSFFLNILHLNIDKLVNNSSKWFNGSVPEDYSEIVSSLMNLSVSFHEEIEKYNDLMTDQKYETFDPCVTIENVLNQISLLLKIKTSFEKVENALINTSKHIFRDSFYNILLCFSQFFNSETECEVIISKELSSVRMVINLKNMTEGIPDLSKLTRVFFPVSKNHEVHMRIGLSIPIENLKRIGGICSLYETNHYKDISITISFPSNEFLLTVQDIRKIYQQDSSGEKTGTVIISIDDKLLEMIIRDTLDDNNYTTEVINPEKLNLAIIEYEPTAIIMDHKIIQKSYGSFNEFNKNFNHSVKTILVGNSSESLNFEFNEKYQLLSFPFEIDTLLEYIEK